MKNRPPFPEEISCLEKLPFFNTLSKALQNEFKIRAMRFIGGVVQDPQDYNIYNKEEYFYVAAAAVMPTLQVQDWVYPGLELIELYKDVDPEGFSAKNTLKQNIFGKIGVSYKKHTLVLSQRVLTLPYLQMEGKEQGLQEYLHLFEDEDVVPEKLPDIIVSYPDTLPFLRLMYDTLLEKQKATLLTIVGSFTAFVAVMGNYFFADSDKMKKNDMKLYEILTDTFVNHNN